MSWFDGIKEVVYSYSGESLLLGVFLVLVLAAFGMSGGKERKYLGVYVGCMVLILNPVFHNLVGGIGGQSVFYRFLWMLPVPLVLAAGMVWLIYRKKTTSGKMITGFLLFWMLMIMGEAYITKEHMKLPENVYGVPDNVIEISELIQEDKEEEYVIAAVDYMTCLGLRQYDATIIYGIDRNSYLKGYVDKAEWDSLEYKELEEQILMRLVNFGDQMDADAVKNCIEDLGIDYFSVVSSVADDSYMDTIGCYRIGETKDCVVYRRRD